MQVIKINCVFVKCSKTRHSIYYIYKIFQDIAHLREQKLINNPSICEQTTNHTQRQNRQKSHLKIII